MNINGFTWLLLAFPVFLLARGKFVKYIQLTGIKSDGEAAASRGATGEW